MLCARRPRTAAAACRLQCGDGSGLEVSLSQLLEHCLVEFGAAGQELVALGELADDLVGGMSPSFGHRAVLLRSSLEHRTRTTPGPLPRDQLRTKQHPSSVQPST